MGKVHIALWLGAVIDISCYIYGLMTGDTLYGTLNLQRPMKPLTARFSFPVQSMLPLCLPLPAV
jgi:hypothetical protein